MTEAITPATNRVGNQPWPPHPPSPLTADVIDGPVPVIRVRGELDLQTAPNLCATVERVAGTRPVMIDLSELSFCDSTGLRALVSATREIEINGGKAALAVPPGGVLARVLELSGLGSSSASRRRPKSRSSGLTSHERIWSNDD